MQLLGWIDSTDEEHRKIVSVLNKITVGGALDEIGIGTIRDGFSERLFPGISTIETRAKYFLTVPYIFDAAEERSYKSDDKIGGMNEVKAYIDKMEHVMIGKFLSNPANKGEEGIIGSVSRDSLVRTPADIYWNGLRVLGIMNRPYTYDSACRQTYLRSRMKHANDKYLADDEKRSLSYDNGTKMVFNNPARKEDEFTNPRIKLSKKEAEYLRDKFTNAEKRDSNDGKIVDASLTKYILENPTALNKNTNGISFESIDVSGMPQELRENVKLAKDFATFIHGAHLLYNAIYSEKPDAEPKEDKYSSAHIRAEFNDWKTNEFVRLDFDRVEEYTGCDEAAIKFVKMFDTYIAANKISKAEELIKMREFEKKGNRAKLLYSIEKYTEPIHAEKLSYRYWTMRGIVTDILEGLAEEETDAE